MKNLKKVKAFTASILVTAMAMSMATGFAAFAEGEDTPATDPTPTVYSLTIDKDDTANVNHTGYHTYEAYQIFSGDLSKEGTESVLSEIKWGSGLGENGANGAALLDELQAIEADDEIYGVLAGKFKDCKTAEDVAKVVCNFGTGDNSTDEKLLAFAKFVGNSKQLAGTHKDFNESNGTAAVTIEVDSGYYLIKDTEDSPKRKTDADGNEILEAYPQKSPSKTRYILQVADGWSAPAKIDAPAIDKNIIENNKKTKYNTASIGDTITYQLDSKVPDTTGYNKYFYIVNDKMDKGLTLQYDEKTLEGVTVAIGKETLTNEKPNAEDKSDEKEFYVETSKDKDGNTEIKIVVKNFVQYAKDDDIVITYNAVLNEYAEIGSKGNYNAVDLVFSNNPNYDYNGIPGTPDPEDPTKPGDPGKPDEPNPGNPDDPDDPKNPKEPTGETPWVKVVTYTAGIELTKVAANDTTKKLTGAEFKIVGEGVNIVVTNQTVFEEAENGKYYKLKDGTYTTTAPDADKMSEDALAKYDSVTQKYEPSEKLVPEDSESKKILENLVVGNDGVLKLYGLNKGTYTITETKAPEGYILKTDPKVIKIDYESISLESCEWTYDTSGVINAKKNTDGILTFDVTNPKGIALPGTGAFGSKIFYALGTIFTGVGAAYMISRRKSKKEEE